MTQFYTVIGADRKIKLAMITNDSNFQVDPGEELLPDTIPVITSTQRITRVDPVPFGATKIVYIVSTDPELIAIKEKGINVCEPLDFIERFTEEEQLAVVTASLTNPQIKLWYDKMLAAKNIKFDDSRTLTGMTALVDLNIISAERSAIILTPIEIN